MLCEAVQIFTLFFSRNPGDFFFSPVNVTSNKSLKIAVIILDLNLDLSHL